MAELVDARASKAFIFYKCDEFKSLSSYALKKKKESKKEQLLFNELNKKKYFITFKNEHYNINYLFCKKKEKYEIANFLSVFKAKKRSAQALIHKAANNPKKQTVLACPSNTKGGSTG